MKKRIIAVIIGMSAILTCSPVLANNKPIVKHVNDVKLAEKSAKVPCNTSNPNILNGNKKLGKPEIKLNEDSLKNSKVKIESRANSKYSLVRDKQPASDSNTTINDSPNRAYTINTDNIYSDTMTSEGGERWYAFENSSNKKLTVIMQALNSTNVDYNLFLFKYNDKTNNLDLVSSSLYPGIANEQLSAIGEEGIYFIGVNSVKGFDDKNPFVFEVISSDQYGANEPDDNILQAKSYESSLSIEDTIDNIFDQDWSKFSITKASRISASLNNVNTSNAYKVDIMNSDLQTVRTINANSSDDFLLSEGTYYARVQSNNGFDPQQKYKFNLTSTTIIGLSPDYKYVVTTDSNKKLYINGKPIDVTWERKHQFNYPGGGYEYRSQQVYQRSDSELIGAQYGTYTSTHTGTIKHAFNLVIKNPQYYYYYTRYYNGGPSDHDEIHEPIPIPVSLIIDVDTGTVVDFNSDNFNFYYINNIETHKFTPASN